MSHTPGPWHINEPYVGTDKEEIADVGSWWPIEDDAEREANAKLIAAAPRMLEALVEAERCIADAEVEFDCKYSGLKQVRAAIDLARGDHA